MKCGDVIPSGAERSADSAVLPGAEPSGCSLPEQKEPGFSGDWRANRQTLTFWNQGTLKHVDGVYVFLCLYLGWWFWGGDQNKADAKKKSSNMSSCITAQFLSLSQPICNTFLFGSGSRVLPVGTIPNPKDPLFSHDKTSKAPLTVWKTTHFCCFFSARCSRCCEHYVDGCK